MFHPGHSVRDRWTAKGAFSVRLFPRDTRSRDVSLRRCVENREALVDNGHYQIAVPQPPFSATQTDGPRDRFGSSSLSLWRVSSEGVGSPLRDDVAIGKVSGCWSGLFRS